VVGSEVDRRFIWISGSTHLETSPGISTIVSRQQLIIMPLPDLAADIQASDCELFPGRTMLTPIHQSLSITNNNSAAQPVSDDIDENVGASLSLPFDLLLEVAAFCAGSFDFKTYLNISLSSKEVHKYLKPVLDEPVLVWDSSTPLPKTFYKACAEETLDVYMRNNGEELSKQASYWSKVRYVTACCRNQGY
jgi:hypothetical protein